MVDGAGSRIDGPMGKVAVLCGGRSAEREVSRMSGEGVLAALRSRGVDAHAFDPAERALDDLAREGFARAFIALHGRHGEDGTVQGALELLGIPYTGSGVMASAVAMDKAFTKRIWTTHGLPTPGFAIARSAAEVAAAADRLGVPLAVKPSREGSSIGFTRLTDRARAAEAYALASRHDEVLCEQFVAGRELTVAILGSGAQARALPVIEIVAPGGNYDYQHKYFGDETRYHCPADLPPEVSAEVQRLALESFHALGCEGWARADLMLGRVAGGDGDDGRRGGNHGNDGNDGGSQASAPRAWLLEINTSPGMTSHSLVPMAARAAGIDYAELCLRILAAASLKTARGGA